MPLLSIILAEIDLMPPVPVPEANEIAAIGPLPETGRLLIAAILMLPGVDVFEENSAPAKRSPWVTVAVPSVSAS